MEEAALPGNFHLTTHLKTYPPENYGLKKFNPDHAKYLLTLIVVIPARYKEIADGMEDNLTPLSSRKMKEVVFNYNLYWSYFEKTGIVEIDKIYRSKKYCPDNPKCRGYRFKAKYDISTVVYSNFGKTFKVRLDAEGAAKYKRLKPDYDHLLKWLWSKNELQIDAQTAHRYVELIRRAQRENPELIEEKRHPEKHYLMKKNPDKQLQHAKANIRSIERRERSFEIDEKRSGRLFSVLTNMKGDLRNLISYEGEQLVSIDLKNSQPYLSTLLLNEEFYTRFKRKQIKLLEEETESRLRELQRETDKELPMLLCGGLLSDFEDVKLFKSLVSYSESTQIGFYEYMLQESKIRGTKNRNGERGFKNRAAAKIGMFEVFFSKNSAPGSAKKLFAQLFPTVNRIFEWIKSKEKDEDGRGGHSLLAMILQNIESTIMLKHITKKLGKRYKTMPMYTIHDSIVVPVKYSAKVKDFMEEELTKLVGLRPTLAVDIWSPENLDWNKYLLPHTK